MSSSAIIDSIAKYKIFKFKNYSEVLIQLSEGNGNLIVYEKKSYSRKIEKYKKKIILFKNSDTIRNYKEFLKLINVNLIIKSKIKLKHSDVHRIVFQICRYLNKKKIESYIHSNSRINYENKNSAIIQPSYKESNLNNRFFHSKLFIVILITTNNYNTIKAKINKENELKLKEYENEYSINKCQTRGHLQALKLTCKNLEDKISIHRKEGVSTLSILVIWIVENFNHIINILGGNSIIFLIFITIIIYKII